MKSGFPSMTALLGLLAVAGYQNRDKLAEMLGGGTSAAGGRPGDAARMGDAGRMGEGGYADRQDRKDGGLLRGPGGAGGLGGGSGLGGLLASLGLGGQQVGGFLGNGLSELMDRFRQAGHGATADSWVAAGPNLGVKADELERALGSDTVSELVQKTGLSREELLTRLSRVLPEAVDGYTPDGRLPG
jgi:uncharacterized protein YidB (DUF937 family)